MKIFVRNLFFQKDNEIGPHTSFLTYLIVGAGRGKMRRSVNRFREECSLGVQRSTLGLGFRAYPATYQYGGATNIPRGAQSKFKNSTRAY